MSEEGRVLPAPRASDTAYEELLGRILDLRPAPGTEVHEQAPAVERGRRVASRRLLHASF